MSALLRGAVLAGLFSLCGCATHTASVPPAEVPAATDAEKPDPRIKPLTLEQEEATAQP